MQCKTAGEIKTHSQTLQVASLHLEKRDGFLVLIMMLKKGGRVTKAQTLDP